jgi:NADPH:quinone reductase-like Zn-dependent oxidoreductase
LTHPPTEADDPNIDERRFARGTVAIMSITAPPHLGPADRIDFTDSRVLVTGGTKGIGAAITQHFVEAHASVIVAERRSRRPKRCATVAR